LIDEDVVVADEENAVTFMGVLSLVVVEFEATIGGGPSDVVITIGLRSLDFFCLSTLIFVLFLFEADFVF